MNNGKQRLIYNGYTYFLYYKSKKYGHTKYMCTGYTNCRAYIIINDNMDILALSEVKHDHKTVKLQKMKSGKYVKI